MARMAVGVVNRLPTPWSAISRSALGGSNPPLRPWTSVSTPKRQGPRMPGTIPAIQAHSPVEWNSSPARTSWLNWNSSCPSR